ncbi:MAG TPA: hypothetical protein VGO13_11400 [Solirubrobacterales bacterium]|jgi:hypothetical protein|nr:hypothetical protein [Solirubrobacterales bacterium]
MESRKRYGIGILASAVALIALVAALTPGAQASGNFTTCANKPVKFQIEDGSGGTRPYTTVVKAISVKGTSCASAYEFLHDSYNQEKISSTGYPQKYKCKNGEFKVPLGYIPTICSKPGKTIKYGAQGG